MGEQNEKEIEIDLVEIFHLLLRKLAIIILCGVIGVVVAGAYTKLLITPQYESTSALYILPTETENVSMQDIQVGSWLTKDFQELALSRPVIESVIDTLHLDMEYGTLKSMITVENPEDTRFLKIKVRCSDPKKAQAIAEEMSSSVAEHVVKIMDMEEPAIAEKASLPDGPVSPSLPKNVVLGGLLGAILAAAVVVIRFLMDDTIKDAEDVKKYLELNVLATLPDTKESKKKR